MQRHSFNINRDEKRDRVRENTSPNGQANCNLDENNNYDDNNNYNLSLIWPRVHMDK